MESENQHSVINIIEHSCDYSAKKMKDWDESGNLLKW